MTMSVSALLLILMSMLQVPVSLAVTVSHNDVALDKTSCQQPNYQYGCQDGVCEFSVSWWRQADVFNVELTTLVLDVAEDSRAAVNITGNVHEAEAMFMCQRSEEGPSQANCSLTEEGKVEQVDCLVANTTFLNPLLKCRFAVPFNNPWLKLLSDPAYLELRSWSHSGSEVSIQEVGPGCLCDFRDCLNTCSCGVTGSKCHSSLYLLLVRSHAVVMVLVFLLLLPTGGIISRYGRPMFPHSWFRAHVLTNTTGVLFMILGLASILGHTHGSFGVGVHQVVGIICISLTLFQALCGFLRPVAGTSFRRRVFNHVHHITGIAILGLGTLALLLGAIMYKNSVYVVIVAVLIAAIVVEVALIAAMEFIMRRNYVLSPPVGYQRVQGRGDDEGEGEGEGGGEEESDKELFVKEGHITQPKPKSEELSKPLQTHISTKRVMAVFVVQGFVFSATICILISYGEH